jgi:hypothetical protein
LQIDWTRQSKNVLDRFGIFQINLISCNTKHAQRYLSFLFIIFTIPGRESNSFDDKKRMLIWSLEPSSNGLPLHDFAHETLHQLVQLVPLYVYSFWSILSSNIHFRASTLLCPIAEQHFPFMTKEIHVQITYVKNLLRSLSYLSIQRLRFLEIILSKLLRLDVNPSYQHFLQSKIFFSFRFTPLGKISFAKKNPVLKMNLSFHLNNSIPMIQIPMPWNMIKLINLIVWCLWYSNI